METSYLGWGGGGALSMSVSVLHTKTDERQTADEVHIYNSSHLM